MREGAWQCAKGRGTAQARCARAWGSRRGRESVDALRGEDDGSAGGGGDSRVQAAGESVKEAAAAAGAGARGRLWGAGLGRASEAAST